MRVTSARALFVVFVLTLVSSTALADVIGPPMTIECPVGARAGTSHCGTQCHPIACASDADCMAGEACAERSLCVEEVSCGGWGATATLVHGECASTCAEGTCQPTRVCVPAEIASDAGPGGGPEHVTWDCGCRGAGRGGSSGAWAALLALALFAIRRAGRR